MTTIIRSTPGRRSIRRSAILLLLFTLATAGICRAQFRTRDENLRKLNRFVQTQQGDAAATRMFRQGRDQIEAEDWQKAAETFNAFVQEYSKEKDVDAALYWLAYALKKQGKTDEASKSLQRLMRDYRNSSWYREGYAMLVELDKQTAEKVITQNNADRQNCEIKILALQSLFEANT